MVGVAAAGPYLRLQFWSGMPSESGPDCDLWIEGAAELSGDGVGIALSPDASVAPVVLTLPGRRVKSAAADADGQLCVSFEDGTSLVVPPGQFESWQLWVNGDNVAGSVAGGGLWSSGEAQQ